MTARLAVRIYSKGLKLRIRDLQDFLEKWDEHTSGLAGELADLADLAFVDIKVNDVIIWRLLGGPIMLEAQVPGYDDDEGDDGRRQRAGTGDSPGDAAREQDTEHVP